ncbi:MAG: hypothetical protein R3E73_11480 [Porticoccaceae bacterium]
MLDGVDVNDYTHLANLRDHVALVSQNVTLFNDTIYNNIAYGELAGRIEEEVRAAAGRPTLWALLNSCQKVLKRWSVMTA